LARKRIIMDSLKSLDTILLVCRTMFDNKGDLDVSIKPYVRDKSWEQLKLWHKWLQEIEEDGTTGYTGAELNKVYNEKFVLPIWIREDIEGYDEVARNLVIMKKSNHEQFPYWRKKVVEDVTKAKLNITQLREALNNLKLYVETDLNIRLTDPDLRGLI